MTSDPAADAAAITRAALEALNKGEPKRARELLQQVIDGGRATPSTWLAVAHACEILGDDTGKKQAVDQALALNPGDLLALVTKGDCLASESDLRGATAYYSAALRYLPRQGELPPHLQAALARAQAASQRVARELEDFVRGELDAKGMTNASMPQRLVSAIDLMFGKKRVYHQEPHYLFYPELPSIEFYERSDFPWLGRVEQATSEIQSELRASIGPGFTPYLTPPPGRPQGKRGGLVNDPSWSALFLWKDGASTAAAALCPRTLASLAEAPLTQIPNRAPSILFSKLGAGAHIPPHTGMLNVRLICHLPLVVPAGCLFRVGNLTRSWVEGEALVFNDTIEHEAWNRSGEDRYVLLFDVWRPELAEEERLGIAALCGAIDQYNGVTSWQA